MGLEQIDGGGCSGGMNEASCSESVAPAVAVVQGTDDRAVSGEEDVMTQDEASAMRIRSLQFWRAATQQRQTTLLTRDGVTATGLLNATDAKQQAFQVSELQTPMGLYRQATVLQSELLKMEISPLPRT